MDDLYGKAEFTAEEIGAMRRALDECGVRDMPAFRKVRRYSLQGVTAPCSKPPVDIDMKIAFKYKVLTRSFIHSFL